MPIVTTADNTQLYVKDWGIAQSTLKEYEGAPHGLFATHKTQLTQDLLAFIGR